MLVDPITKSIWIDESDVGLEAKCPVCGDLYKSNSTGPSSNPALTEIIQKLPSESILGGWAPTVHDWAYLVCPEKWWVMVEIDHRVYSAKDKETADELYYLLMKHQVKTRAKWVTRWWYYLQAKRNYLAVKMAGADSFKHVH